MPIAHGLSQKNTSNAPSPKNPAMGTIQHRVHSPPIAAIDAAILVFIVASIEIIWRSFGQVDDIDVDHFPKGILFYDRSDAG